MDARGRDRVDRLDRARQIGFATALQMITLDGLANDLRRGADALGSEVSSFLQVVRAA